MIEDYIPFIVAGIAILVLLIAIRVVLSWYKIAGPEEALVVSGRGDTKYLVGSGMLVVPVVQRFAGKLNLSNRTLTIRVEQVMTLEAVKIDVEAIAQIRIGSDFDNLKTAGAWWLGKTDEEINRSLTETLGGHLRSIIAELGAEASFQNRTQFATKVLETSIPDLKLLGFICGSFVIREISDRQGYFDALGAKQLADITRNAAIARAEAERMTRESVAAASLAGARAEITARTQQAEAERDRDLKIAEFKQTTDTANATAEMAFNLKTAEIQQTLAINEGQAEVERQRQRVLVSEQEIEIAQRNQQATVVIPAEKERDAAILRAEGQAQSTERAAKAEAEQTRQTRTAIAEVIKLEGEAEAAAAKAKLLATADGTEAQLLAQAKGERELAEARSSESEVNFRLEGLKVLTDGKVRAVAAFSEAMSHLGQGMKVVQFSGGNNGNGNALLGAVQGIPGMVSQLDATTDALFGFKPGEWLIGKLNSGNGQQSEDPLMATASDEHAAPEPSRQDKDVQAAKEVRT